jgi:hypothetical protein
VWAVPWPSSAARCCRHTLCLHSVSAMYGSRNGGSKVHTAAATVCMLYKAWKVCLMLLKALVLVVYVSV